MEWFVYILRCGDDTLYAGISNDVERRFSVHCAGKGAKYTRGRGPLTLVYCEPAADMSAALRRERQIKRLSRQEKLSLIEAGGQTVNDALPRGGHNERKGFDMQEVYDFLKSAGMYFLATAEGDQPRVRPFGTVDVFGGRLYIQTGLKKDVAKQILANPKVELCAFKDGKWIRVTATARLDDSIEAQKHMLEGYPELQAMYQPGDGNTAVFALDNGTAVIASFTEAPQTFTF